MPIAGDDGSFDSGDDGFRELSASAPPAGLQGPVGAPAVYGTNALNKVIVGLARDLPRELRRGSAARRAIRNLGR